MKRILFLSFLILFSGSAVTATLPKTIDKLTNAVKEAKERVTQAKTGESCVPNCMAVRDRITVAEQALKKAEALLETAVATNNLNKACRAIKDEVNLGNYACVIKKGADVGERLSNVCQTITEKCKKQGATLDLDYPNQQIADFERLMRSSIEGVSSEARVCVNYMIDETNNSDNFESKKVESTNQNSFSAKCIRSFENSKACCNLDNIEDCSLETSNNQSKFSWRKLGRVAKDTGKTLLEATPMLLGQMMQLAHIKGDSELVCDLGNVDAVTRGVALKAANLCSRAEASCQDVCPEAFNDLGTAYNACMESYKQECGESTSIRGHCKNTIESINSAYKAGLKKILEKTWTGAEKRTGISIHNDPLAQRTIKEVAEASEFSFVGESICIRVNRFNAPSALDEEELRITQAGVRFCAKANPGKPNPFKKKLNLLNPETSDLSIGSVIGNENGGDLIEAPLYSDMESIDTEGLDDNEFDGTDSLAASDFQKQPWLPGQDSGVPSGGAGSLGGGGDGNGKGEASAGRGGYKKKPKAPHYSTGTRLAGKGNNYRARGKRIPLGSKAGVAVLSKKGKLDMSKYGRRNISSVNARSIFHKLSSRVRKYCKTKKRNCS